MGQEISFPSPRILPPNQGQQMVVMMTNQKTPPHRMETTNLKKDRAERDQFHLDRGDRGGTKEVVQELTVMREEGRDTGRMKAVTGNSRHRPRRSENTGRWSSRRQGRHTAPHPPLRKFFAAEALRSLEPRL